VGETETPTLDEAGIYKSISELMHPRGLPAQFLYIPIRDRFVFVGSEVSLFKPSIFALKPPLISSWQALFSGT
jgi:hypothetical protein